MSETNQVIMLASENDALRGGKVGGVGDVIHDLPIALAGLGWRVTTIIPSYGFLHRDNPATHVAEVSFPFAGKQTRAEVFEVTPKIQTRNVTHLVVEHPEMRGEPIYFNDPPERAFARDATKYAAFCSAVGQFLKTLPQPFVVHLHDWHTGAYFLLKELHPSFTHLQNHRSVFTIHNLAIQGSRPMRGKYESVESWFPELFDEDGNGCGSRANQISGSTPTHPSRFSTGREGGGIKGRGMSPEPASKLIGEIVPSWISNWKDPRYKEPVFTPMAAGIRFAERVNTVSPTYAEEILRPSDHTNGFYGGEGLERYLQDATQEGRLFGILNGTQYPANRTAPILSFSEILHVVASEVTKWNTKKRDPAEQDDAVLERIEKLRNIEPAIILTSVTRVTEQKVRLFFEKGTSGATAMDDIMDALTEHKGVYLFIGTGTKDYEDLLAETFDAHNRFLYLKGYSDAIAQALYQNGTLFLMPSSFEPCGIGQMVAMRDGQPCVVHGMGGLKDTVQHLVNGFVFDGKTIRQQVDDFVAVTKTAMQLHRDDEERWEKIKAEALRARFTWEKSAKQYVELMYSG